MRTQECGYIILSYAALGSRTSLALILSVNERTVVGLTGNGWTFQMLKHSVHALITLIRTFKAGYYLPSTANITPLVELVNSDADTRSAVVTITFEYISSHTSGFRKLAPSRLDVAGSVNGSEVLAIASSVFEYSSTAFKANLTGPITFLAGYLHDGGTQTSSRMVNVYVVTPLDMARRPDMWKITREWR